MLLGGLSIFLYGMEKMSAALKQAAGPQMTDALARLSGNRLVGCLAGCLVTMVLSSSSAASVIVITFVESGLLTFEQCLGVLLGVNIGTTLTGHLVAIKLTKYAWHMVGVGFFAVFFSRAEGTKRKAEILHGLGLLFVGMEVMGKSMEPLQTHEPFRELLAGVRVFAFARPELPPVLQGGQHQQRGGLSECGVAMVVVMIHGDTAVRGRRCRICREGWRPPPSSLS
jgi:phosphate:Na+ symporter